MLRWIPHVVFRTIQVGGWKFIRRWNSQRIVIKRSIDARKQNHVTGRRMMTYFQRTIKKHGLTKHDILEFALYVTKNLHDRRTMFVSRIPRMGDIFFHTVLHEETETAQEMTHLILALLAAAPRPASKRTPSSLRCFKISLHASH